MANNAYIYTKQLKPEDLNEIFIKMKERFPFLNLNLGDVENGECWMLTHEIGTVYSRIQIWYQEPNSELLKEEFGVDSEGYHELEIPHGHGSDLYWFIEHEIRREICERITDALNYDEGIGKYEQETKRCETLLEYLKTYYPEHLVHKIYLILELMDCGFYSPELYPVLGIESPEALREEYKNELLALEQKFEETRRSLELRKS